MEVGRGKDETEERKKKLTKRGKKDVMRGLAMQADPEEVFKRFLEKS